MTPATSPTTSAEPDAAAISLFERVLFFTLLAVLCARPLISESFERLELPFLAAIGVGGDTLARTAWLDSLALTAAAMGLARARVRRRGGRWALFGVGLLTVAVVASVYTAGEKRLALNAGFSLLVGVLCGMALVHLMRAAWMPRLLLAATLATGCTTATKCLTQKAYEFDDTLEYWNEHKEELASRGADLDDPTVINFERRLRSREAFGYQAHPNVTGSLLTMWLLAAGGLLAGWLTGAGTQPRGERVAAVVMCAAVCLLLLVGLWFTGSTGALVALAAGILLLLLLAAFRRSIAARAGRVTALLAAGYLAVIAAALGYGVSQGTLPHPSLAFRWHYWTAAAKAVPDAPLTGLGRANFADAYLLHKPIESTEDVRDPHNLWLSLLVELGPLGLLAGGLLVVGCVAGALRRLGAPDVDGASAESVPTAGTGTGRYSTAGTGAGRDLTAGQVTAAAASVLLLHVLFCGEIVNAATAVLWAVQVGAVWALALVLAARVLDRVPNPAAAAGWQIAGLAAALGAALIGGLIGFALLTPAGLSLFVTLTACAFALRCRVRSTTGPRPAGVVPALAATVLVGVHLALVTIPTMRTEFRLAQARGAAFDPNRLQACLSVLALGRTALACDPLDATAPRAIARQAFWLALNPQAPPDARRELLEQAEEFALTAVQRNPRSSAAHARLATIYQELEDNYLLAARPDDSVKALRRAAEHWHTAVQLHPSDPRKRISAGRAWFDWWEETDDRAAARTAASHFAAALRIDATRQPGEVVRLRRQELATIHDHLRTLEQAGFGVPTASAPAPPPAP